MLPQNKNMTEFLKKNGIITTKVKLITTGSMKGCWSLYGKDQKWTKELIVKLTELGFRDFQNRPFTEWSGNGGMFSVFVRGHEEMMQPCQE